MNDLVEMIRQALLDTATEGDGDFAANEADEISERIMRGMRPVSVVAGPVSVAAIDVLDERRRQIESEGWTPEHDDAEHLPGELALAARCYCVAEEGEAPPAVWPWSVEWWKPKDRRRNMVRAAALLLAEIERLDRRVRPNAELSGPQRPARKDEYGTE